MKFIFIFKRVYGKPKFYPESDAAEICCELAGRVCLSSEDLINVLRLKKLGAVVEVIRYEDHTILTGPELVELIDL